jgi:hypothetical protein
MEASRARPFVVKWQSFSRRLRVEIGERDGEWELRTAEHANFLKSLISPERRQVSMRMVSIRIR